MLHREYPTSSELAGNTTAWLTERSIYRALQSKALELERQRATDNLKKGLAHRPDRETLVERMSDYSLLTAEFIPSSPPAPPYKTQANSEGGNP